MVCVSVLFNDVLEGVSSRRLAVSGPGHEYRIRGIMFAWLANGRYVSMVKKTFNGRCRSADW